MVSLYSAASREGLLAKPVNESTNTEPGYYQDGDFGIRIENIMLIRQADTPNRFGDRDYYGFEHVTVVPIQTKLIKVELLTPEERDWVNAYHRECWEKVSPLLQGNQLALKWLERETRAI